MYNYDVKEERGERRQLKNQIITHPKFYIQGSTYLFRSDPQEGMVGERCKSPPPPIPNWDFGSKMLSKYKKIVYSLTLFGARYKRIVEIEVQT